MKSLKITSEASGGTRSGGMTRRWGLAGQFQWLLLRNHSSNIVQRLLCPRATSLETLGGVAVLLSASLVPPPRSSIPSFSTLDQLDFDLYTSKDRNNGLGTNQDLPRGHIPRGCSKEPNSKMEQAALNVQGHLWQASRLRQPKSWSGQHHWRGTWMIA